ncbi:MAG: hypothetical protein PHQ40_12830 [Anaerolineaceae bacterium]|nr:hypothetical protein [Anaerolineaceae bacterium]
MAFKTSVALRKAAGSGIGYRAALNAQPTGGTGPHTAKLIYYSGTVPADADASIGAAVELCAFTNAGAGLSLGDATEIAGAVVMSINAGETWTGTTVGAGGQPTFFRFTEAADVPTDTTHTYCRLQGTAGIGGSFDLTVGILESAAVNTCNSFDWTIATY